MVAFHEDVPGGATLSVLRVLPELQRRGWRFVLWAPEPSELATYLRDRGFDVRGAPRPVAYSLAALRLEPGPARRLAGLPGYLRRFRAAIAETRPSLLHANSLFTLAEAATARSAGVPVLFHVHEMRPAGRKGVAGTWLAGLVSSELVAVSTACGEELAVGGNRPTIVHEGAIVPERAREDPDGPLTIGTVGVISPRKGTDLFVEAAGIVRRQRPDVRFEIVGAATDALEVAWAHRVLGRADAVGVRWSERADVPERLSGWSAFVLPSRRDPFPISMLEAMGHGLPVIGTEVDGIAEQLDQSAGVLVPPEDPQALAAAIIELVDQPARRKALGAAARARVRGRFTVAAQAEALAAVYERVARPPA